MNELSEYITKIVKIDPSSLDKVLSSFQHRELKKGKCFLRTGQICNHYIFVKKGILRIYLLNGEQEITSWISLENEFFTDLQSMLSQTPTRFYFQALEDTEIEIIDRKAMDKLFSELPQWQEFGRKVWEQKFITMLNGTLSFQSHSSKDRYNFLLQNTGLLKRVPLKILSSYIGITTTSISRLRKSITQSN